VISITRGPEADFAATAVGAAAGVAAVAAGVPVLAAVGVEDDSAGAADVTSATVAGTFSFLPHPAARSAAAIAMGRKRIFMAKTTLGALMRHANPKSDRGRVVRPR
jgi:hypothetical protein